MWAWAAWMADPCFAASVLAGWRGNMEPEMKKCGNAECQAFLPDEWKHAYCEACRKARRKQTVMDLLCAPGIIAMKIATRGNRRYGQNKDNS